MLSLVPAPYKILGVALLAGLLAITCFVGGRKSKQGEIDTLRQSYQVAAAQAAGARKERERMWTEAITVAGDKFNERAKIADASFDSSLDRLRSAYNSSARLRLTPKDAGSCPIDSIGTKAELLREAETLAAAIRDATRDRAGLEAAKEGWPR